MEIQQQWGEWYPLLKHTLAEPWMQKIGRLIFKEKDIIQPSIDNIFRAFTLCPPSKVKVVIIGQDPYIRGEADGLAFSSYGKMTPSLEVVFEEINRTHAIKRKQTHLDDWAVQGVFLLNSILTTIPGQSKAHENWGWELFIIQVLSVLGKIEHPIVYMLWGKDAQSVVKMVPIGTTGNAVIRTATNIPRLILKAPHPQAQNWNPANKFVGCSHFIECNQFLVDHGASPVWWADPQPPPEIWTSYVEYFKLRSHVKVDLTPLMYSYPAIPDKPHPFSERLGPEYAADLPF